MYDTVRHFWTAVKQAFPHAWGLPAEQSRLMHSAGIEAMGSLMDHLMPRALQQAEPWVFLQRTLEAIAPNCAWTEGQWPDLKADWDEIQSTSRDIRKLTEQLIRLARANELTAEM